MRPTPKKIEKVNIPDAKRLSPMEMNNLHFKTADAYSPLSSRPSSSKS